MSPLEGLRCGRLDRIATADTFTPVTTALGA
jgi:hypothetical protein